MKLLFPLNIIYNELTKKKIVKFSNYKIFQKLFYKLSYNL